MAPGADSNCAAGPPVAKAVSMRGDSFTRARGGGGGGRWEDIQVHWLWLEGRGGRRGGPVGGLRARPYKGLGSLQALLSQPQHPLLLQGHTPPVLCGHDRKRDRDKKQSLQRRLTYKKGPSRGLIRFFFFGNYSVSCCTQSDYLK